MPDLYAVLGIPRTADRSAIRSAYRRRAKAAHPDTGGSPKQFALVKLAHDTLTDDDRRARYDRTGEAEEVPVDNRRAQLLEMLAAGLDAAMAKLYNQSRPPIQADMVRLTKEALRESRGKWNAERREVEKRIVIAGELLGRFTAKGENLMEVIVTHRVKVCEGHIASLDARIEVVDRALASLDDMTFRADPVPVPVQTWGSGRARAESVLGILGASFDH